jgi:hypothetical protein
VHENIFAGFPLDESEAFGRVKPLHCTFFSHCKNLKAESQPKIPQKPLARKQNKAAAVGYCAALRKICE